MARMDFGDLDFEFSHKNLSQENYLKLKDEFSNLYQDLCKKHQSISDYGLGFELFVDFNDENKSIEIDVPSDWQQDKLFVLFVLQKKALSILDIPGFHRHIPSDLNDFSDEAKDDFFKFCNQFLKEIKGEFYANWQVFTDGGYWSCGVDRSYNNNGDYVKGDYFQHEYDEEEDEDW